MENGEKQKNRILSTKEKILDTLKKIDELKQLNTEFSKTEQNRKLLKSLVTKLLKNLEKKNSEIEELEKLSLKSLFSSVVGTKSNKLNNLRDEYLQLSKRYDNVKKELATIDFEYEILNRKLDNLTKLKKELEVLSDIREKELMSENSTQGHTLKQIVNEKLEEVDRKENIERTIDIISQLFTKLTLLNAALRDIEGSKSWGSRRKFKYGSIQGERALTKAKEYNLDCKLLINKLEHFLRYLGYADVDINLRLLNVENFSGSIFQNIFSDLVIQRRVADAIDNVEQVYREVNAIKDKLNNELVECDKKIERLENVKKQVILE